MPSPGAAGAIAGASRAAGPRAVASRGAFLSSTGASAGPAGTQLKKRASPRGLGGSALWPRARAARIIFAVAFLTDFK